MNNKGVEAPNAAEASVQNANSMPIDALDATEAYRYAISTKRFFSAREAAGVRFVDVRQVARP